MANQKTKRRPLVLIIVLLLSAAAAYFVLVKINQPSSTADDISTDEVSADIAPIEPETPDLINLQPVVDEWVTTLGPKASVGLYFYDLDNASVVAEHNPDERFSTASLYKLFVVYEGYRRIETGVENPDTIIYSDYSLAKCLDLAIRESHSGCAETIHKRIGINNLQSIIANDYNLSNSSAAGLYSTAAEISAMLKIYYNHTDLSEETWATIQDSMLNQPPVYNGLCSKACDWRQGFPSGFTTAKVYNKVGWQSSNGGWKIYDDAAIVELDGHTYIMTIMSQWVYPSEIAKLGTAIESAILSNN